MSKQEILYASHGVTDKQRNLNLLNEIALSEFDKSPIQRRSTSKLIQEYHAKKYSCVFVEKA